MALKYIVNVKSLTNHFTSQIKSFKSSHHRTLKTFNLNLNHVIAQTNQQIKVSLKTQKSSHVVTNNSVEEKSCDETRQTYVRIKMKELKEWDMNGDWMGTPNNNKKYVSVNNIKTVTNDIHIYYNESNGGGREKLGESRNDWGIG